MRFPNTCRASTISPLLLGRNAGKRGSCLAQRRENMDIYLILSLLLMTADTKTGSGSWNPSAVEIALDFLFLTERTFTFALGRECLLFVAEHIPEYLCQLEPFSLLSLHQRYFTPEHAYSSVMYSLLLVSRPVSDLLWFPRFPLVHKAGPPFITDFHLLLSCPSPCHERMLTWAEWCSHLAKSLWKRNTIGAESTKERLFKNNSKLLLGSLYLFMAFSPLSGGIGIESEAW